MTYIHLILCKLITDLKLFITQQYLKQFNSVETIAVVVYQQISHSSFKNEIIYKLFTYKSYMCIDLTVCKND